jgi:hypothetical protein
MGGSRTACSDIVAPLLALFDGLVERKAVLFCLNVSVIINSCMAVKLSGDSHKEYRREETNEQVFYVLSMCVWLGSSFLRLYNMHSCVSWLCFGVATFVAIC